MVPKTLNTISEICFNNRNKIGEGIYLLYFALMVGARAAGLYEGMTIYNISLVIGMMLFVCKMIVTKHTVKEYVIAAAFLAIAGIVYIHTGEKGLIVCFTMMLGMKEVSEEKVIKVGAVVAGIIIMSKIFLGVFGFVPEIYYPQERDGIGLMFRHALGYAHPNTLHMNVLMFSMMVMYLMTVGLMIDRKWAGAPNLVMHKAENQSRDEIKSSRNNCLVLLFISLIVFLFNIYIFKYSGSRTGLLASIVYLIVNFWLFVRKKIGVFEKIISFAAFPIVSMISIVFPLVLTGRVYDFLNYSVFTTRYDIANYFWKNNSISLWGIRLNNPEKRMKSYGLDMAQCYLLLQLGLVAFILIAGLTIWFIYQAIKRNKRAELAVLMGMLFLGIWEPLLYNLGFKNFVYVFMGSILYTCLNEYKEEELNIKETTSLNFDLVKHKKIIQLSMISAVIGIIVAMIYLCFTKVPLSLYGNREQDESGQSFGMEAYYFSENEIQQIKENGDLVIGYTDSQTPMYKYDSVIANIEYKNRVMSAGVWGGMLAFLVGNGAILIKTRNKSII